MDRIISLLAALVGLIALAGAILVHVNGDVQRNELAAEIAELKTTIAGGPAISVSQTPSASEASASPSSASASVPFVEVSASAPSIDSAATEISELKARIAELEQQNRDQASALAEAQAKIGGPASAPALPMPAASALSTSVAAASEASSASAIIASSAGSSEMPASSIASSSVAPASSIGPIADCIPAGTRFVGKPGDSFAICKTPVVVKIAAVADGIATVAGVGPIEAGSFGDIPGKGCSIMVFSADATGFADLRVTCQ